MFGAEVDHSSRLVHVPRDVPNIEIFSRIHHEELAKAVHKARRAPHLFLVFRTIVINRAPVYLYNWKFARVAPDSDGRRVGIVVNAKQKAVKAMKASHEGHSVSHNPGVVKAAKSEEDRQKQFWLVKVVTYAMDPHENPTNR